MQTHVWPSAHDFRFFVADFDRACRAEGFHVLHDWDGKAGRSLPSTIAEDVLAFFAAQRAGEQPDARTVAILVDYYFLYLAALVAMRAWDDPKPGELLDRLTGIITTLQTTSAAGHRFVDNAESLLLLATSHYEPVESGFDLLLARARELPRRNQFALALIHAQALGPHLRFAYDVTCLGKIDAMRADNVADYPWLCFSVATLTEEYAGLARESASADLWSPIVDALLNAVSVDPIGLLDDPPASLAACEAERAAFSRLFSALAPGLRARFEAFRPLDEGFAPLGLSFNFSHNLVKGAIVDALLTGEPWPVSLNELLAWAPEGAPGAAERLALARTLMGYARARPDTIGGRLAPVIVYDPAAGRRWFMATMRALDARGSRTADSL